MNNRVIRCYYCHKPLGKTNLQTFLDGCINDLIGGGRDIFCNEKCYNNYLQKYFVEEYNGSKIYWVFKNNTKFYIPYPGCHYGFKTIKDCKVRVDSKVAIPI